jgi:arylsulfatase A-like enzyme
MGRARRIFSGLFDSGASGSRPRSGLRACLRIAVWLWLLDAAVALARAHDFGLPRLHGLFAGLGFAVLIAVPAGLVLDGLLALARIDTSDFGARQQLLFAYAARALRGGDPQRESGRVGAVLGELPLLALFCGAGYLGSKTVIMDMVQPHFAAITLVALFVCLMLLCALLRPVTREVGERAARALGELPVVGGLFGSAFGLLAALFAAGLVIAAALLVAFWSTFALLPWRTIGVGAGAVALAVASFELRLGRPRLAAAEDRVLGALCALSFAAMCLLSPRGEVSRRAVFDTLPGRLGNAAAVFALDFDRDGHLAVFGGGDCAEWNGGVSPSALDVPNNGRDEDCDGADLDAKRLAVELRRDWPVPAAFPRKPPIVLITIDTFAASRMHALGNKRAVTPKLDAYAARSALFRYAFAEGPSTRLSFPALFTSRWDSEIKKKAAPGSRPSAIDDGETLLAEALAAEGYDTNAVVPDIYFRRTRWPSITAGFNKVAEGPSRVFGTHNSDAVTDTALDLLKKERKKPLFLWVHYYDAHSPHVQPKAIETFGTTHADVYDAELKMCDREVGRLLAAIDKLPEAQAPVVVITGDHGIAFDSPRHTQFNYGYDLTTPVLHVPLIVHGPQIKPQVNDSIVSLMDVAPTLTNLAHVSRKLPFEGASLVPELLEGRASRPERLVHQFYLPERTFEDADPLEAISLRTDRFNLIHDRKHGSFELYDWRADYFENHNLADDKKYASTLLGMKRQLALYTYRLYGGEQAKSTQASLGPAH